MTRRPPISIPAAEAAGSGGDPVELADLITNRLFRVTLDLHHIRALTEHPAATGRVDRVIDELDHAINELRHLVTAVAPYPEQSP